MDTPGELSPRLTESPLLAEASWPPLSERIIAAGHVDYNLIGHMADEIVSSGINGASSVARDLLNAGSGVQPDIIRGPEHARTDALLLQFAQRIADKVGWMVVPKPGNEVVEGTER